MDRRDFLKRASALAGVGALPCAAGPTSAADGAWRAYENNLQDRLWMWGHDSGAYDGPNGVYNIPLSDSISMADAIHFMGIPNVRVIRGGTPDAEYRKQFRDVKRLSWNLSSGSNASYYALKEYDFGLLEEMPNLVGFDLDDFFHGGPNLKVQTEKGEVEVSPASLSLQELTELRARMKAYSRPLDLKAVLYSAQLKPSITPAMELVDTVGLWTWAGADVMKLEENFRVYRECVPKKPTLLGIYMWDFGNKKPMEMEFMEHQLAVALDLFKRGEIEGMIFHCTPLCNKNLEAVAFSREWIQKHGQERR